MKKKVLFAVLLLLAMGGVAGQGGNSSGRFEWVRGYAPGDLVNIIGSVTDSAGNLYILGSFNFASRWENGELLMPITPRGGAQDGGNILISKISPEGEMVWKKVIHGNYSISLPHDIKAVGDTAFACLVTMPLAMNYNFYLYYLDTLVEANWESWPNYPISSEGMDSRCLALITFDFDGNVLEQHFLQMSYLDRNEEDIYYIYPPGAGAEDFLSTWVPENPSFGIDGEGNIYLSRMVNDYTFGFSDVYRLKDGDISAVKFWCDRRLVGIVPADSTLLGSPQILKFAPHFDTLLSSRHVFQSQTALSTQYISTWVDKYGDLYVVGTLEGPNGNFLVIDSNDNLFVNKTSVNDQKGFMTRFDSTLASKYCITLEDSVISPNLPGSSTLFHDITFDYDSNLLFLCASTGRGRSGDTMSFYSILTYQGTPLERLKNDAFVISFFMNDSALLHSYGCIPSKIESHALPTSLYDNHGNIVCQNNRVIIQCKGFGGFNFPNHTISFPQWSDGSLGHVIFDYQGSVIGGDSYSVFGPSSNVGSLSLQDSILYCINRLSSSATFGDIEVPSRGEYFACIAKYVDTAFMTPYVAPAPQDPPAPESIHIADTSAINGYPNPVRDKLHIATREPVILATAISLTGIRKQVPVKGNTLDLAPLLPGVYIMEIITDSHKYHYKIIKL